MRFLLILLALTAIFSLRTPAQTRGEDKESLEHAIDYFNNGKYHEALLLFRDIAKRHRLSERMLAQLAICEYHDWNFREAAEIFDSIAPQLKPYAPHERSVYYFAAAESHFNLQNYEQAINYYTQVLPLCYPQEKGQAHYRLGFCCMFLGKPDEAREQFTAALENFRLHPSSDASTPKISQLERMIRGLKSKKNAENKEKVAQ